MLTKTVLRIRDILVRIRIRGSVPLTNESGSGSGSCYFRQWPSRWQRKIKCFSCFFVFYFLTLHLHHFSKIKSHKDPYLVLTDPYPQHCKKATRFNSGGLEYVHIDPESDVSDLLLALVRATEGARPVPLPATPHRISQGTVSREGTQYCFQLF